MYLQKVTSIKNCVKKSWRSMTKIAGSGYRIRIRIHLSRACIRGSGSTQKCHGSGTLLIMLRCTGERLYGDGVQRWRGGLPIPPAGYRAEADRRELQVSHGIKLFFFGSGFRLLHGIKIVFFGSGSRLSYGIQLVFFPDPDPSCCLIWIRSGFRPRFFLTRF